MVKPPAGPRRDAVAQGTAMLRRLAIMADQVDEVIPFELLVELTDDELEEFRTEYRKTQDRLRPLSRRLTAQADRRRRDDREKARALDDEDGAAMGA